MKLPAIEFEPSKKSITDFLKREIGNKKAIIGLSGGIDSTLIAYLLNESIPRTNIVAVCMNEYGNKDLDAFEVVRDLRLNYWNHPIENIFSEFKRTLVMKEFTDNKLAHNNIKPRIRMTLLYAYANALNGVVIGTTNRSEWLTGYFTKFGDGGVDLEPIIDMYKTQEKEFARELGLPQKIIDKAPTAGLWEGQTDEAELGLTYRTLDQILYCRFEKGMSWEDIPDPDFPEGEYLPDIFKEHPAMKVKKLYESSQHKRMLAKGADLKFDYGGLTE